MRKLTRIILASGSPRRVELLANLGLTFEQMPSEIDETVEGEPAPGQLVVNLSVAKAAAVAANLQESNGARTLIIGADTIVVVDGEVLGKPVSRQDAISMLRKLSGRNHTVFTGVAIVPVPEGEVLTGFAASEVYFRPLSDQEIEAYVDTDEPTDKAGAYALQGIGSAFVEKIEGCFTNIIGLPVPLTVQLLRQCGLTVLGVP